MLASKLFDSSIFGAPEAALDFITNVLQASTEYSVIGKGLDGTILLWNEGARRLYGYEPGEVVDTANSRILHTAEDIAAGLPEKMTAFAMKGDEEKAREAGCDGYITKPLDTRRLSGQVTAHLRAPGAT